LQLIFLKIIFTLGRGAQPPVFFNAKEKTIKRLSVCENLQLLFLKDIFAMERPFDGLRASDDSPPAFSAIENI